MTVKAARTRFGCTSDRYTTRFPPATTRERYCLRPTHCATIGTFDAIEAADLDYILANCAVFDDLRHQLQPDRALLVRDDHIAETGYTAARSRAV